jgi:tRNA (Thr-GGU) A37 N-methylase
MHVLEPYVAPLSLEVPPMAPQEKTLDKISAKLVAHTMAKQEKENVKQQRKLVEGEATQDELAEQEKEALKKLKKMEYIVVDYIRSY